MIYTDELADRICELISEGHGIRKICNLPNFPAKATLFRWLNEYPKFQREYIIARQIQAEMMLDEMLDIAMNCPANSSEIRRASLKISTLQWLVPKMLPKKYGISGTGWNADEANTSDELDLTVLTNEELDLLVSLYTKMNPESPLAQRPAISGAV
jgi:hypothetical protein